MRSVQLEWWSSTLLFGLEHMWVTTYNSTFEFYLPLHFPREKKYRHYRRYRQNPFENSFPPKHFWFTERETPKEKGDRLRHNWFAYNYKARQDLKEKEMTLKAHIVATLPNGLIGLDDKLPWHYNKPDMEFFKRKTMGHVVVMGYNTVMSLPKKLEGRHVVGVFSPDRSIVNAVDGFYTKADHGLVGVEGFLDDISIPNGFNQELIYIAGGAKIYQRTISEVDIVFRNELFHPHRPDLEYTQEHYYPLEVLEKDFLCISKYCHGTLDNINGPVSMCEEIWVRKK